MCGRIYLTASGSWGDPAEQSSEPQQVIDVEEGPPLCQDGERIRRRFARPRGRHGAQLTAFIPVIDPRLAPDVLDDDELVCAAAQRMEGVDDLEFS
jgi:hypothetical protein